MRSMTNALEALGELLLWNRLHRSKYLPGLMLCLIGISLTVIAAPSDLDPTFGTGGKVVSSPDGSQMTPGSRMVLQPDGKIVMVGSITTSSASLAFLVARYNSDGSLDTAFGTNGSTSFTIGADSNGGTVVGIQPDGKIVVGGTIRNTVGGAPEYDFGIGRLNSDGTLDTTFDGDGKMAISFTSTPAYADFITSLKIAADGKIVVGGFAISGAVDSYFLLGRLNPDGSRDASFGSNGLLIPSRHGIYDRLEDFVILPDGKIVAAGHSHSQKFATRIVEKYNVNGSVEWTYDQTLQGFFLEQELHGIALQPDGKFVAVGHYLNKIIAIRVNPDGTEDNSFLNPAMPTGEAVSVAVQSDGKIVANVSTGTASSFSLIRYNVNGSLDSRFGTGGFVYTNVTTGQDYANKVLIQPNGRILVGGGSELSFPEGRFFSMVRYMGDVVLPPKTLFDYDYDSKADVSVFRPSENKWYVLRSSDSGLTELVFAIAGDIPVPADYDGDGKTDFAIFRPSMGDWWYLSSANNTQNVCHWGQLGDIPKPSDFDGDGRSDFVLFRPSNNVWYRMASSTRVSSITTFGAAGDKPVIGDFDGDRKSDLAIFRPSTGDWWYQSSINNAWLPTHWGVSTDIPAPADFDGDGKTDFAVYKPSNGNWYILNSSNGSFTIVNFGTSEDKPVPADYDGDAKADIAVFRPSTGTWHLLQTTAGYRSVQWGVSTDIPTENAFIP